jgi:hypothetical protein
MKKVEVWETLDGKYFPLDQEKEAKLHEDTANIQLNRRKLFSEQIPFIQEHIFNNLKSDLRNSNIIKDQIDCYYEGEFGWECKGENNPIDKCIYSWDTYHGDDMCVFCGEPEERK